MIRKPVLALMLAAFWAAPALAEPPPPGPEDGRFTFRQVEDGFLRLDQRTGTVALCSRRPAGWTCELAPDERGALEAEIARLQRESAGLKQALLDNGITPPDGDSARRRSGQADLDRMAAAVEKAWRRLVEMMETLRKNFADKT